MQHHDRPAAGEAFPALMLHTLAEGDIALESVSGWRLLVVYRGAHCRICKTYLKTLEGLRTAYADAGITVYAVSADPKERAAAEAEAEGWQLPVAFDLSLDDMRRLGVYVSEPRSAQETDRPFAEPAVFVINPDGRLQVADISNAPFARPDLGALLKGLKFVQEKHYPVRGTA